MTELLAAMSLSGVAAAAVMPVSVVLLGLFGYRHGLFLATVVGLVLLTGDCTVTIKGIDEADNLAGEVSWIAPIARALLKAREGDEVKLQTPGGVEVLEVITVQYPAPAG
jgi:transcription elongation factor GreB